MALKFENKVPQSYRKPFIEKVKSIAKKLNIDPNWLMGIMDLETGGTFSPSITNSLGYTGLLQWGEPAANQIGTTRAKLRQMSAVDQLDYVYKHFEPHKKKLTSYVDTYLQVFFPVAVGKGDDFIIQSKGISAEKAAKSNPLFDKNKDNKIYVWEIKKALLERLPSEWVNDGSFSLLSKAYKNQIIVGIALIAAGAGAFAYYKLKK